MKERIFAWLAGLDPRMLLGGMVLLVALVALEGWLLLLRQPLAEYQRLVAARQSMSSALGAAKGQQGDLGRLAADLKLVNARVGEKLRPPGPDDQVASVLMADLDRSATSHGVTLAGIRPGARRRVQSFEELLFEVNAQGKYLPLCRWLMDFERTLGQSATVSEFTMKSADEGRLVALSLKIALYRPIESSGVAK